MRLCLIPSTICSICLRNCSFAAEEDMALKDRTGTSARVSHTCSSPRGRFYSLLEVVVNRVEQIDLRRRKEPADDAFTGLLMMRSLTSFSR